MAVHQTLFNLLIDTTKILKVYRHSRNKNHRLKENAFLFKKNAKEDRISIKLWLNVTLRGSENRDTSQNGLFRKKKNGCTYLNKISGDDFYNVIQRKLENL